MPLYEYLCPDHGKFEARNPITDRGVTSCPECGQSSKRIMSTFNWSFGWRISDRSMNVPWAPKDELVRNL